MIRPLFIGVDFDGTCVTNEFPKMGKNIGAGPVLRELQKMHKIILLTMRSDVLAQPDGSTPVNPAMTKIVPGHYLTEAIDWFKKERITLEAVNRNVMQESFTTSTKVFCDLYIDDSNLGALLVRDKSPKAYINWVATLAKLRMHGYINMEQEPFEELLEEVMRES